MVVQISIPTLSGADLHNVQNLNSSGFGDLIQFVELGCVESLYVQVPQASVCLFRGGVSGAALDCRSPLIFTHGSTYHSTRHFD